METHQDQDPKEVIIHDEFDRKLVLIDNNRVVKSGHVRPQEPEALRFVSENTTIPVPKVHEVRWKDGRIESFVMDYMPGRRLDHVWDTLNSDQKLVIADELHAYYEQLRALKGDYIGAVNNGKAIIGQRVKLECGPFKSEKEFNEFILNDIVSVAPDLLRHYAKAALWEGHEIVFAHCDFEPRNILVEDGHVTAILDWEYAGWYPEYWEYALVYSYSRQMPDWPEYLPRILPLKYEKEFIGMTWLCRFLSH